MAAASPGGGGRRPFAEAWEALLATQASGAALLTDAEAALAELAVDVARRKAATKRGGGGGAPDHRTHPAVAALLGACPLPGLAAYVASAPGPIPRPPRGRSAQLSDRLSAAVAGTAAGAEVGRRAADAVAALAAKPEAELIEAARRCPHVDWGGRGGGNEGGGDAAAAAAAAAAPAVVALAAAGLETAATLRSRVAAAVADPGVLAVDDDNQPRLGSYALLWGLAPFLDDRVVAAVVALEAALLEGGGDE